MVGAFEMRKWISSSSDKNYLILNSIWPNCVLHLDIIVLRHYTGLKLKCC